MYQRLRAPHILLALGTAKLCTGTQLNPIFFSIIFSKNYFLQGLFGICNYGVHINGFVNHPNVGLCIWLQQRSLTKQTWPGKWDNMVAGGLSVGNSVIKTAHKEGEEEASLTPDLLKNLKSAGTVS